MLKEHGAIEAYTHTYKERIAAKKKILSFSLSVILKQKLHQTRWFPPLQSFQTTLGNKLLLTNTIHDSQELRLTAAK